MPHIVTAFGNELRDVREAIMAMGKLAHEQVAGAVDALLRLDSDAATIVLKRDAEMDALERQVNETVFRLLALRSPLANDLRRTIAAMKIAADMERIGDYAANIAKRSLTLSQVGPLIAADQFRTMSEKVLEILDEVAQAYIDRDAALAVSAWSRDHEVDALHTAVFQDIVERMIDDPKLCSTGTHLLFISKNIERIGDHATNVAENVHFLVSGHTISGDRPKEDEASLTVVKVDQ
ncbi:phosphate signaling complex protein PhoU [Inquilinus sp. CAU 1745]|uniref:phosphate signaling complex protein PhoU n=1 Tax=Inquilinus sp. CAU 1745 TaxID=3140369 RepID=UPI00325A520B